MLNTTIDQNSRNVGMGFAPDIFNVVQPLALNPVNGKLLIEIIPVGSAGTIISSTDINIDGNSHQVAAGVTDDSNQNIIPLTVNMLGAPNPIACLRADVI